MAFNLQQIKSEITKRKYMPENSYEFFVPVPSFVSSRVTGSSNMLRLRTEAVQLPGINFLNIDNYKPYGFGPTYTIPYGLNITAISATHILDGDSKLHRVFETWASNIVYWKPQAQGLYSVNYLKDYTVDVKIITYNSDSQAAGIYILRDAYPTTVDQLSLAWNTTNEYAKLNVFWKFTDWYIDNQS